MSEQDSVTSPLLKALNRIPGVWAMRIHSGRARGGRQHLAPVGTPDILAIVRGRPLFFECKTELGKASPAQMEQARRIGHAGACTYVVRSVTDGMRIVRIAMRDQ